MKTTLAFAVLIAFAAVLAAGIPPIGEMSPRRSHHFTGLGDLAGGIFDSSAHGVSADGSVVIGCSTSETGVQAVRWTRREGMVALGFPGAFAVSEDGSAVVGYRSIADGSEPVLWTQHEGLQGLGNIAECVFGVARGISRDGSVIVGGCEPSPGRSMAFQWMQGRGMARLELPRHAVVGAEAYAVSADGDVVVGVIETAERREAFRWTSHGFVELGALPGDTDSMAHAVSADGSVVVGVSWSSWFDGNAFRWTEETGMVDLGTLPGGTHSCALGVSADGSVIVGQSHGKFGLEAFVWDTSRRMRSVRQRLISESEWDANLRHWKLRSATAVSRDGSTIVGYGTNPRGDREAWIARLEH